MAHYVILGVFCLRIPETQPRRAEVAFRRTSLLQVVRRHQAESFFFFFAQTQRQSASTHLEAAAQGVYFSPQRCVFLRDFVLLLSLVFSFLQSLSQLAVKPESTQKHTGKKTKNG